VRLKRVHVREVAQPQGTLISAAEAERVRASIAQAKADGARILTGGERDGARVAPAVVADVDPSSAFSQDELFGPAVAVSVADAVESGWVAEAATLSRREHRPVRVDEVRE
jgi:acyl-CoA reductase-like NAD-dependent aldehyde dehydrogenase